MVPVVLLGGGAHLHSRFVARENLLLTLVDVYQNQVSYEEWDDTETPGWWKDWT